MIERHRTGLRMRLGRLAAAGLAAVLAAGPLAAWSAAPATAAAKPGYVAIVVDGQGKYCVPWKSGITGDAVLNAVATVHYRQPDGIIDAIDKIPSASPAPSATDDTHYWSYWHDTSGSWSYSTLGASSFKPVAGSVEGWKYDNGSSVKPAPKPVENPSGLYATLCGAHDRTAGGSSGGGTPRQGAPTQHVSATRTAGTGEHVYHPRAGSASIHRTSTSARSATSSSAASTSAPPSSSAAPRQSASPSHPACTSPSRSAGRPARRSTASRPSPSGTACASGSAATGAASTGSAAPAAATGSSSEAGAPIAGVDFTPAAESSPSSSGSLTSVLVGVGLVLLLGGGAAFVVFRRRSLGAE